MIGRAISHIVALFFAVFLELVFGIPGTIFAWSLFLINAELPEWLRVGILFITFFFVDVFSLRTFGVTGVVMFSLFLLWTYAKSLSRWRFVLYLALGLCSVLFLDFPGSGLDVLSATVVTSAISLSVQWIILRTSLYAIHTKT